MAGPQEPRLASDSQSPAGPTSGPQPASPQRPRQQATAHVTPAAWRARCASGLGFGAASPSSWDMGRGQKGGRPLAHHALLLCGEPGSKSLIADLLFGPGCVQMQSGSLAAIYWKSALDMRVCRKRKKKKTKTKQNKQKKKIKKEKLTKKRLDQCGEK